MNWVQIGLFVAYVFFVLLAGVGIYDILSRKIKSVINKSLYLGEALLLGSIFLVGELLVLSLLHLYKAPFLWGAVALNCLFLKKQSVRKNFTFLFNKKCFFDITNVVFLVIVGVLVFRNLYFMVDVDSHSTYLYTQKLWLSAGTSLIGSVGHDIRIFIPQFDAVPYSLGLAFFGNETLFPQLINVFWRIIVLLLVFGYTKHRFGNLSSLAAVMLVAFNDHFFYSGVNQFVLINGAVIAFLFAAVYNFWEAGKRNDSFRFCLAFIFLVQLMANKYQMAYIFLFVLAMGLLIQKELKKMLFVFWSDRLARWCFIGAAGFVSFWYVKNLIVTGNPFFPILAGKLQVFNWTSEQGRVFMKVLGGRSFSKILKYLSYLFIWPGIKAAKLVLITLIFSPLIFMWTFLRRRIDFERITEVCFWLGISLGGIIGLCLACHQDPRYYRYLIAILSFTSVVSVQYVFRYCLNIKRLAIAGIVLFLLAFSGWRIAGMSVGPIFKRPTIKENVDVLLSRIHMDYAIEKHFPKVPIILTAFVKQQEKTKQAAWEFEEATNVPAFLLPQRPRVSLWYTTVINWDSYASREAIVDDLKKAGIEWLIRMGDNKLIFISAQNYAKEAVSLERFPTKIYYDYNFPPELSLVTY